MKRINCSGISYFFPRLRLLLLLVIMSVSTGVAPLLSQTFDRYGNLRESYNGVWVNLKVKEMTEKYGSYGRFANHCNSADKIYLSSIYIDGSEVNAFQPGGADYNIGTLTGDTFNMYVYPADFDAEETFRITVIRNDTMYINGLNRTDIFFRINTSEEYGSFSGERYLKTFYQLGKKYLLYDLQQETEKEIHITQNDIRGWEPYHYYFSMIKGEDLLVLQQEEKKRYFFMTPDKEFILLSETDIKHPHSSGLFIIDSTYLLIREKPEGGYYPVDKDLIPEIYRINILLNRFKPASFPAKENLYDNKYTDGEALYPTEMTMLYFDEIEKPIRYAFARYSLPVSADFASLVVTCKHVNDVITSYLINCDKGNLTMIDKLEIANNKTDNPFISKESLIEKDKVVVSYFINKDGKKIILKTTTYIIETHGYFTEQETIYHVGDEFWEDFYGDIDL